MNILITAEPYAYGPISKAIVLAKKLKDKHNILFFCRDSSYEFAILNGFKTEVYIKDQSKERLEVLFDDFDVIINVMNFELKEHIKNFKKPIYYLDTLLWFWKHDFWENLICDMYFVQNFPGSKSLLSKLKWKDKNKIKLLGPIIDLNYKSTTQNRQSILMNFGGLESDFVKIGKNSNYPFIMIKMFCYNIFKIFKKPIHVTTRPKICKLLNQEFNEPWLTIGVLNSKDFLTKLNQSFCLFTNPGLETVYEAFEYDVPTYFLPPAHNSQYWQLQTYMNKGLAPYNFKLANFPQEIFENSSTREIETNHILKYWQYFELNDLVLNQVYKLINEFSFECSVNRDKLIKKQKKFMDELGVNGTNEIIKYINEIIHDDIKLL